MTDSSEVSNVGPKVVDQLIEIDEGIRNFIFSHVLVIAFAALVVVAQYANAAVDEGQAVLEAVRAGGEWVRQPPNRYIGERFRDRWLYLYLVLEFQARVDPFMAVRLLTYIGLLYQDVYWPNASVR